MKRRLFLTASSQTAAALTCCVGCDSKSAKNIPDTRKVSEDGTLAGMTLEELRGYYHSCLFDEFLPFMDKYVIDNEYGGFMCGADRDGTRLHTDKDSWYMGRGIWAYSYLYNNLIKDKHYLDVSQKAIDFILKIKPSGDNMWPRKLTRTGEAKRKPTDEVYGDLFIAHGLAEFSKASGDDRYYEIAKDLLEKCLRVYDRSDYQTHIAKTYLGTDAPLLPGARIVGVWMMLILVSTQMLEQKHDPDIEKVADRCVDALMNYHVNPEFELMNELLNPDLSRPDNELDQLSTGHSWETLWMIMIEAMRRKDKNLFALAVTRFRRHIECAMDDVYGGVFTTCHNVNENIWSLNKATWPQEEILVGTMIVLEHTGAPWAKDLFTKTFAYVNDKFYLKQYGYPMFSRGGDRKGAYDIHHTRTLIDPFHNPRRLMMNLTALERIIKRGGNISGFENA